MIFVPKISITDIPLDGTSLRISDITGDIAGSPIDPTGYDASGIYLYYPRVNDQWMKLCQLQKIGTLPATALYNPTSDFSNTITAKVDANLTDGVWLVTEYWYVESDNGNFSATWTLSPDKKTITKDSGNDAWVENGVLPGIFSGLYGVMRSKGSPVLSIPDDISPITEVTSTTVKLSIALDAATTDSSPLFLIYKVQKYALVMLKGENALITDIGNLSLSELQGQGCNEEKIKGYCKRLMTKLAAQIAFKCGNYAKAHNAAILFADSQSIDSNCSNC